MWVTFRRPACPTVHDNFIMPKQGWFDNKFIQGNENILLWGSSKDDECEDISNLIEICKEHFNKTLTTIFEVRQHTCITDCVYRSVGWSLVCQ